MNQQFDVWFQGVPVLDNGSYAFDCWLLNAAVLDTGYLGNYPPHRRGFASFFD